MKKYSSLWCEKYMYIKYATVFWIQKGGKNTFTNRGKKTLKKYRTFTIAHAQHTTLIWNVQNERDNKKKKTEQN